MGDRAVSGTGRSLLATRPAAASQRQSVVPIIQLTSFRVGASSNGRGSVLSRGAQAGRKLHTMMIFKLKVLAFLLLILGALIGIAATVLLQASDPALLAADTPVQKGLAVHEWGVFSAYNDLELANADMRAEWDGLPKFVYGQVDSRKIPVYNGPVRAPVIYFHAPQATNLNVRVDFPKGRPAVWWPATVVQGGGLRGIEDHQPPNSLVWQVQLKAVNAAQVTPLTLPKGHWMEALRAVQADDVLINQPYAGGTQKERFIYYDGLIPAPKGLTIKVVRQNVALLSQAKDPVHDVTVIDLRNAGKIRVARLDKMEPGAEVKEVVFTEGDQTKWPSEPVAMLVKQLQSAGLHEDEARSLATVWRKDFFETEGVSVFYRLPQEVHEKALPLTVTPRPEKVVRTLLMHHPHCEPELGERVLALVKQLDAQKFEDRLDAHQRLQKLGRAAFIHLVRARNSKPTLEVSRRLDKLLEEFEAEVAFRK